MYKIIGADGLEYGPVAEEQLRRWVAEGRANAQTRVLAQGAETWKMLGELPEFYVLFATPQPQLQAQPGLTAPSSPATSNPMAIAGLVMGITSVVLVWCCYGLPFNILGIIFSLIGLSQTRDPQRPQGRGATLWRGWRSRF